MASADSVTYGINSTSVLNKLQNFHVVNNQLPQDVMHIFLEGVIPHLLKLMLNSFIATKKYFTLEFLNIRLKSFLFSRSERRDKPAPISLRMIQPEGRINQSGVVVHCLLIVFMFYAIIAAQMWNLAVYLPLMVGEKIPLEDNEWECYLTLLDILQICMAKILSVDLINYLTALIEIHLRLFKDCYPTVNIIPKQHYMVHLPNQALK